MKANTIRNCNRCKRSILWDKEIKAVVIFPKGWDYSKGEGKSKPFDLCSICRNDVRRSHFVEIVEMDIGVMMPSHSQDFELN